MYRIYADDTLIYDSTLTDYKIGKGLIYLETDKSGSFTFSIYPDHFFYDSFVRLKTVITVYKSGRIKFRGRILNDVTDYWNNKVITCEGELGFLQDSVIRPFEFTGTPEALFKKFIQEHNSQVDEFKRFKIGTITVVDPNDYVNRSSTDYGNTLSTLTSATTGSALGGHIYITHGDDGTDPIPTIHYLEDFTKVASQKIEFGSNLKNYTKTVKAEDIATAIIPLGTTVSSDNERLTIADVNNGVDFIYSEVGVALYGWIFKTVVWEDVTLPNNLKAKAEEYLESVVNQNITIELNAIDLHLLDRSIESFNVCDYVHVVSEPHNFDAVLLCNKQTIDLLKPENDTVVLGYETTTFTGSSNDMASSVSTLGKQVSSIKQDASSIKLQVETLDKSVASFEITAEEIRAEISDEVEGLNSSIEQTATSIRSEISDEVKNLESSIDQAIDGITLSVTNGEKSSKIVLKAGEATLASETIKFTGTVVFESDLEDGNTTVSGDCITTGEVSADYIKLGGTMNIYADLDDKSEAGWLGYVTGSISGNRFTGIGMIATEDTAVLGSALDDVVILSVDDTGIFAGNNIDLHADNKVRINSEYLIPYEDEVTYCGSYSYGWKDGYFKSLHVNGSAITSSDRRVKENINYDLTPYLSIFDNLKPCSYKFIEGVRTHLGMIAQEVEEVATAANIDLEHIAAVCIDENNDIYGLRYEEFVPLLIAKVQMLDAEVKELKSKYE